MANGRRYASEPAFFTRIACRPTRFCLRPQRHNIRDVFGLGSFRGDAPGRLAAGNRNAESLCVDPIVIAHGRYATNDFYRAVFLFLTAYCGTEPCGLEGLPIMRSRAARSGWPMHQAIRSSARARGGADMLLAPARSAIARARRGHHGVGCDGNCGRVVSRPNLPLSRRSPRLAGPRPRRAARLPFWSTFRHGHWYFYPAVAAVKTPLAVFVLVALTVVAIFRAKRLAPDSLVLLLPATLYAIVCIASPIDLGIRVLLPIYPLLYAFIALNLPLPRWRWAIAAVLAHWSLNQRWSIRTTWRSLMRSPAVRRKVPAICSTEHRLGTRHEETQGLLGRTRHPRRLHRVLWDGLSVLLRHRAAAVAWIRQPQRYSQARLRSGGQRYVAVRRPRDAGPTWGWLRQRVPDARIGYSIYVYDFRKHP